MLVLNLGAMHDVSTKYCVVLNVRCGFGGRPATAKSSQYGVESIIPQIGHAQREIAVTMP